MRVEKRVEKSEKRSASVEGVRVEKDRELKKRE